MTYNNPIHRGVVIWFKTKDNVANIIKLTF